MFAKGNEVIFHPNSTQFSPFEKNNFRTQLTGIPYLFLR